MLSDLGVGELFEGAAKAVACIVDDYVYAAELFEGGGEGGIDVLGDCDIELDDEIIFWVCVFEGEGRGVASCGYGDVAFVEDFLNEVLPKTRACAGD